ncbi:DUF4303 domain-containing protein [Mariniluteicoccus flavus]
MTEVAQLTEFFDDWTPRYAAALADAVRAEKASIGSQKVYVAAITVADGNQVPALNLCTVEHFAELTADIDEADEDETREYYRWWPDEWGWEADLAAGTTQLANELYAFVSAHGIDPDEGADAAATWSKEWLDASTDALCTALGSAEVREAFKELGADPVLYVTETDGGADRALETFERLNVGRDDKAVRDARAFWEDEAKNG